VKDSRDAIFIMVVCKYKQFILLHVSG